MMASTNCGRRILAKAGTEMQKLAPSPFKPVSWRECRCGVDLGVGGKVWVGIYHSGRYFEMWG
jgi:hypothetical protein